MAHVKQTWLGVVFLGLAVVLQTSTVRADKKADPTGTWKWERNFGDNTVQFTLRLDLKGDKVTGTYATSRAKTRIQHGKVDKDQLSFQVDREFNDRKFTIKFRGKVSEDTIKGKGAFSADGKSREFDWEAKRTVGLADVVGTWRFRIETGNGNSLEPSLKLAIKGKKISGVYTSRRGDIEAKKIEIKDNQLTFEISGENDGNQWKVTYKGKPRGNSMKGTIDYDFGGNTGTVEFEGKRGSEKKEKEDTKQKQENQKKD